MFNHRHFLVLLIVEHLADLRDIGIRLHGDGRFCGNNHDVHIKQFCVRQFREFAAGHASDQRGNVGNRRVVLCEAAQYVAIGDEADHVAFVIDDRHAADVLFQHHAHCVTYRGIRGYRVNVMLHHIGNGLDIQSGNMLLRGLVPSGSIADGVNYLAGQWRDDQHLNRQRDGEIVGEHAPESRERAECETECHDGAEYGHEHGHQRHHEEFDRDAFPYRTVGCRAECIHNRAGAWRADAQIANHVGHVGQRPVEQCVAPRRRTDVTDTYAVIECRHHINHDRGHDETEENALLAVTWHGTSFRYAFDVLLHRPLWSVPHVMFQQERGRLGGA